MHNRKEDNSSRDNIYCLKEGGTANVYVTRWEQVVRIEADKIYLLSPSNPDDFCQGLKTN